MFMFWCEKLWFLPATSSSVSMIPGRFKLSKAFQLNNCINTDCCRNFYSTYTQRPSGTRKASILFSSKSTKQNDFYQTDYFPENAQDYIHDKQQTRLAQMSLINILSYVITKKSHNHVRNKTKK